MNKIRVALIGSAAVFLAAGLAFAQTEGKRSQHDPQQKDGIMKELNLSPEQQKKLEDNRNAQRQEMTRLHQSIREKQVKLGEELKNPAVTRSSIEPLVSEIKSLQAQALDQRINAIFAVKGILTPEQFVKFQQLVEKRMAVRKERLQDWKDKKKETGPVQNQEKAE